MPAKHRVVTSTDGDMSAATIPDVVRDWKSQLHLGWANLYGKWLAPTGDKSPSLKAIEFAPQENKAVTVYQETSELCYAATLP